jgi:hypothetical protein
MTKEQVGSVFFPEHTPEVIAWRIAGGIRYPQEASLRGDCGIMVYAGRVLGSRALGLRDSPPNLAGNVSEEATLGLSAT